MEEFKSPAEGISYKSGVDKRIKYLSVTIKVMKIKGQDKECIQSHSRSEIIDIRSRRPMAIVCSKHRY